MPSLPGPAGNGGESQPSSPPVLISAFTERQSRPYPVSGASCVTQRAIPQAPMTYENSSHEALGSDLMAVLNTMRFPEEVLGPYWLERLRSMNHEAWYPMQTMLELQQQVLHRGGRASLVQMGRQFFLDTHHQRMGGKLRSAGDVIYGLDRMYRFANRGQNIGGWEVLGFGPGHGVLRKKTPYHCAVDEGFLHEALQSVGVVVLIVQPACSLTGATTCELELCSSMRDQRWTGEHPSK